MGGEGLLQLVDVLVLLSCYVYGRERVKVRQAAVSLAGASGGRR